MSSMMDVGYQLLASIVDDNDRQFLVNHVLREDMFYGEEIKAFNAIMQHVTQYSVIPRRDTLESQSLRLLSAPEPTNYYYDRVLDRYRHKRLVTALESANELLSKEDSTSALDLLSAESSELWQLNNQNALLDLRESMPMFKQFVVDSFQGKKGIPVPWPYLNLQSGGLLGGDLVSIIGRPQQGKSWLILYWAWKVWLLGYSPLIFSMEMKPLLIMKRWVAMAASLNMDHVKHGHIDDYEHGKILQLETEMQGSQVPIYLVDGELIATTQDVFRQIAILKPDIVFVDGAYLLGHINKRLGKYEKVAESVRDLKRMTTVFDIPVVASFQFNRGAVKKKQKGLEDIGFTDEIGQLSSLILGLNQPDTAATIVRKIIELMKGRSGEVGRWPIHWDFIKTDFSQIEEDQAMEFIP